MTCATSYRWDRFRPLAGRSDPFLAEFRRFMSRLQQIATLPLDVVDDAPPIETAMHADGDESGLARHDAGPLCHQCSTASASSVTATAAERSSARNNTVGRLERWLQNPFVGRLEDAREGR